MKVTTKEWILTGLGCSAIIPQIYKLLIHGTQGVEIGFFLINLIFHTMAMWYLRRAVLVVNILFLVKNLLALIVMVYLATYSISIFPMIVAILMMLALFHSKRFQINSLLCYLLGPLMLFTTAVTTIIQGQAIQISFITMFVYVILTYLEYDSTIHIRPVYAYANIFGTMLFGALCIIVILQCIWIT